MHTPTKGHTVGVLCSTSGYFTWMLPVCRLRHAIAPRRPRRKRSLKRVQLAPYVPLGDQNCPLVNRSCPLETEKLIRRLKLRLQLGQFLFLVFNFLFRGVVFVLHKPTTILTPFNRRWIDPRITSTVHSTWATVCSKRHFDSDSCTMPQWLINKEKCWPWKRPISRNCWPTLRYEIRWDIIVHEQTMWTSEATFRSHGLFMSNDVQSPTGWGMLHRQWIGRQHSHILLLASICEWNVVQTSHLNQYWITILCMPFCLGGIDRSYGLQNIEGSRAASWGERQKHIFARNAKLFLKAHNEQK